MSLWVIALLLLMAFGTGWIIHHNVQRIVSRCSNSNEEMLNFVTEAINHFGLWFTTTFDVCVLVRPCSINKQVHHYINLQYRGQEECGEWRGKCRAGTAFVIINNSNCCNWRRPVVYSSVFLSLCSVLTLCPTMEIQLDIIKLPKPNNNKTELKWVEVGKGGN